MAFRGFASDVGASTVRVGLSLARGLVLIPVVTRAVSVEAYGLWTASMAVLAVAASVGGLHLHGGVVRYLPVESTDGRTAADLLAAAVVVGTAGGVALALVVRWLAPFGAERFLGVPLWAALGVALFAKVPLRVARNVPRARGRVKRYELVRVVGLVAETLALLAAFLWTGSVVAAVLAVAAVALGLGAALVAAYWPRGVVPSTANLREYAAYCLPMVPKELGSQVLYLADRVLLLVLVSPFAAGVYAVAYAVPRLLSRLTQVLNPSLYPAVVGAWEDGDAEAVAALYRSVFRWYVLIGVPAAVGVSLLADPAIRVLSTPSVARQGSFLVPLLAAGFFVRGFEDAAVYVLTAAEETPRIGTANVVAGGVNLTLNLALIPTVGVLGAAVATVVGQVVLAALVLRRVVVHVRLPVPWATLGKAAAATTCMALVLRAVPVAVGPSARLVVFPALGAVVYFAALALLGEVGREDLPSMP